MRIMLWFGGLSLIVAGLAGLFHIGGILLVLLLLVILRFLFRGSLTPRRLVRIIHFLLDYAKDVTWSNLILAWDVITPWDLHRIRLIEVDVSDLDRGEIAILSHRINLSPGTLTCHLSEDGRTLLVHDMYGSGEDRAAQLRAPIDILRGKG